MKAFLAIWDEEGAQWLYDRVDASVALAIGQDASEVYDAQVRVYGPSGCILGAFGSGNPMSFIADEALSELEQYWAA